MIVVEHLQKRYGDHLAVKDLSFTVEQGKIYGLLGPNGAGKSTTMNMVTGCLAPTAGRVTIDGNDIFTRPMQAKRCIGYLPELPPLYPDMTPKEYLCFVAGLKGVKKAELTQEVTHVMHVTQIEKMQDRLIKNLSKGYRQRVGIAQAILGNPKVIILDEPTVGLDPMQIIEIRQLIQSLGREHTVILSSHILSEVQAVCDHVMIISKGELVASDTPENLNRLFCGMTSLSLLVKGGVERAKTVLRAIEGVSEPICEAGEDGTTRVALQGKDELSLREAIFYACAKEDLPILELSGKRASLEDIFLEFTQAEASDGAMADNREEAVQ